jgi:hypothetical protein
MSKVVVPLNEMAPVIIVAPALNAMVAVNASTNPKIITIFCIIFISLVL